MSYLCFADDLIIFSEATASSLQCIQSVLDEFYHLLGLEVNFSKSELLCNNANESIQINLATVLGIKKGTPLMRYLGVPLIAGKLSEGGCKALVDKITARIQSWTSKFLSFAGRLQLICSVLESFTNYWCTIFLIPKKVLKAVSRLCSAFL